MWRLRGGSLFSGADRVSFEVWGRGGVGWGERAWCLYEVSPPSLATSSESGCVPSLELVTIRVERSGGGSWAVHA